MTWVLHCRKNIKKNIKHLDFWTYYEEGFTVSLGISATDICLGEKVKIKHENSKGFFPQYC